MTAEKSNCYNSQPCVHLTALAETRQRRSALIRWFPSNKPTRMEKKISPIYIFTVAYKYRKSSTMYIAGYYRAYYMASCTRGQDESNSAHDWLPMPSGQDGAIFPTQDNPPCPARKISPRDIQ